MGNWKHEIGEMTAYWHSNGIYHGVYENKTTCAIWRGKIKHFYSATFLEESTNE